MIMKSIYNFLVKNSFISKIYAWYLDKKSFKSKILYKNKLALSVELIAHD